MYGGYTYVLGHTDIWGMHWGHTYRGNTGGVQMYGGIQMYMRHTEVWACTNVWGSIQMYRAYRHGGCTGGIQMYEGIEGFIDVWEMYTCTGGIEMYGSKQMYRGMY